MTAPQLQIKQKSKKKKKLSVYQLKSADLHNIPIANVKKLLLKSFDKKGVCFIMRTYNFT